MSETVIKVENLSKQYRLGQVGTGTLSHDVNRFWHKVRGKEDPYMKIGEENDRTVKGGSEYVWALRDINFEVKHGELLGIIGRNGAGKSTLLKILSRTTKPTNGHIKVRGRIASLLEVGTGFHPELSGKDNIFLNGAILGMTKSEIRSKFDEIVDFAGVEKYIETPVKRYSSGMYVRLAFAVAAHLEPEILIVDEVLAVGDAEFQKKAIGKMKDVSEGQGRTVLFVSHNLTAVRRLCQRGLLLKNGTVVCNDSIEKVLDVYDLEFPSRDKNFSVSYPLDESRDMQLLNVELLKPHGHLRIFTGDELVFEFEGISRRPVQGAYITIDITDKNDEQVYWTSDYLTERFSSNEPGRWQLSCVCPKNILTAGRYTATFAIYSPSMDKIVHYVSDLQISFELEENETSFLHQFGIPRPGKTGVESAWHSKYI